MLPQIEIHFIEFFSIKGKTFIIGNICRPHGGCLELFLNTMEDILCEVLGKYRTSKVFIMGEYNIDLLKSNRITMYFKYFTMMSPFGIRSN